MYVQQADVQIRFYTSSSEPLLTANAITFHGHFLIIVGKKSNDT